MFRECTKFVHLPTGSSLKKQAGRPFEIRAWKGKLFCWDYTSWRRYAVR